MKEKGKCTVVGFFPRFLIKNYLFLLIQLALTTVRDFSLRQISYCGLTITSPPQNTEYRTDVLVEFGL